MIAEPVILQRGHGYNSGGVKQGKCPTFTASDSFVYNNLVAVPVRIGHIGKGGLGERIYSDYTKLTCLTAIISYASFTR